MMCEFHRYTKNTASALKRWNTPRRALPKNRAEALEQKNLAGGFLGVGFPLDSKTLEVRS